VNGVLLDLVAASRARPVEAGQAPAGPRPSLCEALRGRERVSLIAEFKRRSPSDRVFAPQVDLLSQLHRYQQAGAAAVSVLTEPTRFCGSMQDLRAAVTASDLPILRKDFLVRPEQVRESAANGASAVLLIVRCLPGALLDEMVAASRAVGVEMLIECHDEADLERALPFEDAALGVNNRDLDTLRVDREVVTRLAPRVPERRILVAESGYTEAAQLEPLVGLCDAVLVGSALMRGAAAQTFVAGGRS